MGEPILPFVAPRRNTQIHKQIERIIEGRPIKNFESLCRRKEGSHFYASITITPVKNPGDGISGMLFIARDINEIRQMQKA